MKKKLCLLLDSILNIAITQEFEKAYHIRSLFKENWIFFAFFFAFKTRNQLVSLSKTFSEKPFWVFLSLEAQLDGNFFEESELLKSQIFWIPGQTGDFSSIYDGFSIFHARTTRSKGVMKNSFDEFWPCYSKSILISIWLCQNHLYLISYKIKSIIKRWGKKLFSNKWSIVSNLLVINI